jgi:hypothetical protein
VFRLCFFLYVYLVFVFAPSCESLPLLALAMASYVALAIYMFGAVVGPRAMAALVFLPLCAQLAAFWSDPGGHFFFVSETTSLIAAYAAGSFFAMSLEAVGLLNSAFPATAVTAEVLASAVPLLSTSELLLCVCLSPLVASYARGSPRVWLPLAFILHAALYLRPLLEPPLPAPALEERAPLPASVVEAAAPAPAAPKKTCHACGEVVERGSGRRMKRCPCKQVYYCGTACQKADYPHHKSVCSARGGGEREGGE